MGQKFRIAQESRAKLTVRGVREEAGSPEVREDPRGRKWSRVQDGSGVQG